MSTAAEPFDGSGMNDEGGTARRCRLRHVLPVVVASALLLGGCSGIPGPDAGPSEGTSDAGGDGIGSDSGSAGGADEEAADSEACTSFWGDPHYTHPLARDVLDRVATAPENGPSDPMFYSFTADDIDDLFEGDPAAAEAGTVSDWLRTQPERGEQADLDAFEQAWDDLADTCGGSSDAAAWHAEPGEDGTKPAALVCYEVYDEPQALTHFGNANVMTSNMFALVGLGPKTVPGDRMDDVQRSAEVLATQIDAVDDDAVREGLEEVRAPLADALDGSTASPGLQEPLDRLATACTDAGYTVTYDEQEQGEGA